MSRPPQPETPENEAHDPAWALLDRARRVTPSTQFSRRVLSAVHADQTLRRSRWSWLRHLLTPSFRPALAAAAVALLILGAWFLPALIRPSPTAAHPPAAVPTPTDESEEIVQTVAAELALLETADHLLDPQDGLDLEEADIDRLLF